MLREHRTAQISKLRLRPSLYAKIRKAAQLSGRPTTHEIEARLEASFGRTDEIIKRLGTIEDVLDEVPSMS